MAEWPDPVNSVLPMLKLLPNVETIYFGFDQGSPFDDVLMNNLCEFMEHPKLFLIDNNDGILIRGSNLQFKWLMKPKLNPHLINEQKDKVGLLEPLKSSSYINDIVY